MPTPSIQTLTTDAQQVLNLDSISAVRSVVAVALANANTGTPLNPNLTTQQLWNEFYQVVTKPKSDIESIIANQLMKFLFAPPAPGGAGADKQVIFNDGGVLAGDADFLWNKTTNLLTVTGAATITGDLTVDTSTLKVDAANNRVGIGTASPTQVLTVRGNVLTTAAAGTDSYANVSTDGVQNSYLGFNNSGSTNAAGASNNNTYIGNGNNYGTQIVGNSNILASFGTTGVFNWYDGAGGTRMTLNSTGLGIGVTPSGSGGCLQLKSGITFPATQVASSDANTLDDYEEGTFTATLKGTVSDPTTPVTTTARYTKIGRVVTVTIQFSSVTTTGASGRIQIDGLPFTNNSSLAGTGSVGFNGMATFTGSPFASLSASSSTIAMFASNSAGAYTAVTFNAGTTQDLWTSLTYTV